MEFTEITVITCLEIGFRETKLEKWFKVFYPTGPSNEVIKCKLGIKFKARRNCLGQILVHLIPLSIEVEAKKEERIISLLREGVVEL